MASNRIRANAVEPPDAQSSTPQTRKQPRTGLLGSKRTPWITILALIIGAYSPAYGANWIVLQGSEAPGKGKPLNVWGFIQPTVRTINDNVIDIDGADPPFDGLRPVFNTLTPDRNAGSGETALARARLGARGIAHPKHPEVNYFFLAEFGVNGITRLNQPDGGVAPALTDSSATFRHFAGGLSDDPYNLGISFRIGQMKLPMADEGSRGVMAFDYINFSEVTRQQVLERFVRANPTNIDSNTNGTTADENRLIGFDGSLSAFRDIGVQFFDEFRITNKWEGTWAVTLGNGNGINRLDNDDNTDLYLRAQAAYVFDGVKRGGPRREDLKLFGWTQRGKRLFDADNSGAFDDDEAFDRNRYGFGFHLYKQPFRLSGEYIAGNGMVFAGTTGQNVFAPGTGPCPNTPDGSDCFGGPPISDPASAAGATPRIAAHEDNEFTGYYIEGGWFPIRNKLALQARYDYLDRLNETGGAFSAADERKFKTLSVGFQYWMHPVKSQWKFSYRFRDLKAPNDSAAAKQIVDSMGDEIALQYFLLFK